MLTDWLNEECLEHAGKLKFVHEYAHTCACMELSRHLFLSLSIFLSVPLSLYLSLSLFDRWRGCEREGERERGREGERERERGRRERERGMERELLFFFKGMTGALAPFSYLVIYIEYSHQKQGGKWASISADFYTIVRNMTTVLGLYYKTFL